MTAQIATALSRLVRSDNLTRGSGDTYMVTKPKRVTDTFR
jgi:hypothetical protein